MQNYFQIPTVSPIKLYWQSDILNTGAYTQAAYKVFDPNQNSRNIDEYFFSKNIQSWLQKATFFQPWQQTDKIVLQWLGVADYTSPSYGAYTVSIVDENNMIVKQVAATEVAETAPGSGLFIREAILYLHDVPEGKYVVQIHKVGLFTDYDYFAISEPISVKKFQKDTILIRYKHSENAYQVFWETGIEMWIRIPGSLTKLQPESKIAAYEDDEYNLTLLSGVKYRSWQLTVGVGSKQVPSYFIDMLEGITLCDTLYIENILYTRPENAVFEINNVDKYQLSTANMPLREKINNNPLTVTSFPPIVLGLAPESEWFSVRSLNATSPAQKYPIGKYFNGALSFVGFLNASNIIGDIDFVDTFFAINSQSQIILNTNKQSVYDAFSAGLTWSYLLEGHLILDIDTADGLKIVVEFANVFGLFTNLKYYYGDGNTYEVFNSNADSTDNTYAANSKFKAYLFWNQLETLGLDSSQPIIKSIKGKLPYRTKYLYCQNNIVELVENNLFENAGGFIEGVDLSGNKLTSFNVDDFFRWAYDAEDQFATSATLTLNNQQTPAPPTPDAGLSYINGYLLSNNITLTTD